MDYKQKSKPNISSKALFIRNLFSFMFNGNGSCEVQLLTLYLKKLKMKVDYKDVIIYHQSLRSGILFSNDLLEN